MFTSYPAKYRDTKGEAATIIYNDGKRLYMRVRGIDFSGDDFDSFEPSVGFDHSDVALFSLSFGALNSCIIEYVILLPIAHDNAILPGVLQVQWELGDVKNLGASYGRMLHLGLTIDGTTYETRKDHRGFFEPALLEIQEALPSNAYIISCLNCALSDIGNYRGAFGALGCYRGNKEAYFK